MNLEIRNTPRARSLLARLLPQKRLLSTAADTLIGILSLLAVARTIATKQQQRGVQQNEIADWLTRPGGCCTVRSANDRGPSRVNKKM
jgi:hypothetical protein